MKILFYNDYRYRPGGAETYWRETAASLEHEGMDVNILSFEYCGRPDTGTTIEGETTFLSDADAGVLLNETLAQFKPDIVHLNNHSRYAHVIGSTLKNSGLPIVSTVHDYYSVPFPINFKNRLKSLFFSCNRYCSNYIIPSRHYYDLLKKKNVAGVKHIPHFIDFSKWTFNNEYDDSRMELLFVGRLEKIKGADVLIAAVKILIAKFPALHLTIIGEGSEMPRLQKIIVESGLSSAVTLAGSMEQNRILQYYHCASILVMPSVRDEMLGLVGPEAQASGLPVVACDVAGVREWCHHGKTGLLVPPGDPLSLADNLEALIRQPKMRHRLRKRARAFVERHFSEKNAIPALIRYYTQLGQK